MCNLLDTLEQAYASSHTQTSVKERLADTLSDIAIDQTVQEYYPDNIITRERFNKHKNNFYASLVGIVHSPMHGKTNELDRSLRFIGAYPRIARAIAIRRFLEQASGSLENRIVSVGKALLAYGYEGLSQSEINSVMSCQSSPLTAKALMEALCVFPNRDEYQEVLYRAYINVLSNDVDNMQDPDIDTMKDRYFQ